MFSSTTVALERVPGPRPACRTPCQTPACSLIHPFLHPQVYTRYGKCYTFNGDRRNPRVTRQGGMGNGLEIMLDIQQEEYLPIWRETSEWGHGAGRAQARVGDREGRWGNRAPQDRDVWGKWGTGRVLGSRTKILGGHRSTVEGCPHRQDCSLSVLLPQTRRHLKLVSESRFTARMSHPTSISWALVSRLASRPLCPARSSG